MHMRKGYKPSELKENQFAPCSDALHCHTREGTLNKRDAFFDSSTTNEQIDPNASAPTSPLARYPKKAAELWHQRHMRPQAF